jgi:hypothetical protein
VFWVLLFIDPYTLKPVLRGHLWDKEKKWSFKTDDLLKEVSSYEIFCDRTRKR